MESLSEELREFMEEQFNPPKRQLAKDMGIDVDELEDAIQGKILNDRVEMLVRVFLDTNGYDKTVKKCFTCNKILPRNSENFYKSGCSGDGLRGVCRKCVNKQERERRKRRKNILEEVTSEYLKGMPENKRKYKVCSTCGVNKKRDRDNYYRNPTALDGLMNQCIKCNIEANRKWVKDNRDTRKEYNKKYYKRNSEKIKSNTDKFRKENPKYMEKWVEENPNKAREAWTVSSNNRRAREAELANTLTVEELDRIKKYFNNSCAYCGISENELKESMQIDHIVPIAREIKGTERTNIVPACASCNQSKGSKKLSEWYPKKSFYTKRRHKNIGKVKEDALFTSN